jgi:hypothetical protein
VDRRWYVFGGSASALILLILTVLLVDGGSPEQFAGDDAITVGPVPTATLIESGSTSSSSSTTARSTSTSAPTTTFPDRPTVTVVGLDAYEFAVDENDPAVAARPSPVEIDPSERPPTTVAPPPWAASTALTSGGHLGTDVGCAADISVESLDRFLAERVGPVLGWDYQHVYPLGDDRFLWLFQDAFVDHTGVVDRLGSARFIHNAALIQDGTCFQLLHRGSPNQPDAFEVGDGTADLKTKWYWPMGGELVDGELWVFWAEMIKDPYDPDPPQGLGWHPERTFLASYDAVTLERTSFFPAPNSGAVPIYGYAVSSDDTHTYLFGNTFEQNMIRDGGFWNGPHSATDMWLARVPLGRVAEAPEYHTADGWSPDPDLAEPILSRFFAENPMQPRFLDGQWVAATAVDGYWGDHLLVDVAPDPWGPWTTVEYSPLLPRNEDPKMNTYHAHTLPWRDGFGSVLITVSNNARDMLRDAWNHPYRYRPMVFHVPYQPTPTTTTTSTTVPPTSTSTSTTSSSTSTSPSTSTTSTSSTTTSTSTSTTSTSSTTTSTTTTTVVPTSTSTSSTTSTSTSTSTSTTTSVVVDA